MTKVCQKCQGTNFNSINRCRPCWAAYMRDYNKNNPEKTKEHHRKYKKTPNYKNSVLKHHYDISLEMYHNILTAQNNVCAICQLPETCMSSLTNKTKMLAVDHDHSTGKVRGLLCSKCNRGLGYFKDNLSFLKNAIDYLGMER